jgi:hypothetical protein
MKLKDGFVGVVEIPFQPPYDCDGLLYTADSVGCSILGKGVLI